MQFISMRPEDMGLSRKLLSMEEVIELERRAKQRQSLFEAIRSQSEKGQKNSGSDRAEVETDTSSFRYERDIVIKSLAQSPDPKNPPSCKCKKSRCLRMYCECFSLYGYCGPHCSCLNCHNLPEQESLRRSTLLYLRNKYPDIKRKLENIEKQRVQPISCNCKKSFCQKKYCECFVMGLSCNANCRCVGCRNTCSRVLAQQVSSFLTEDSRQDVVKKPKREHSPLRDNDCLRYMTYNSSQQKFIDF